MAPSSNRARRRAGSKNRCQTGGVQRTLEAALPFPLFVALSFGVHAAVSVALTTVAEHEAQAPKQAFDPSSQGIAGETLEVEPAPPAPEESDWTPVPVEALPQATPTPPVTAAPGPGPR